MTEAHARTPLHALHIELGARMVPFAGYEMPLQYAEGLRAEHLWTRSHAGLFDVSHMGQVRVTGEGVHAALERALPVDFDDWPAGLQRYSLLLSERGGIEDDLMLTRLESEVRIVVNAACRRTDQERLRTLCPRLQFSPVEDALLALQGPGAEEALPEAAGLRFMHTGRFRVAGTECFVARSGYTGEDGFEISVSSADAVSLARHLLGKAMVKPAGLGARDTLRLEAGLPLYGQDMDAQTTPAEAGLGWAIVRSRRAGGAKEGGFPGAQLVGRAERRFVGLLGLTSVPVRHGAQLIDAQGAAVGEVTSGTVSPTLGKPIMMAYVRASVPEQASLRALVRQQPQPVARTRLPFVPKRYKR